MSVPIGGEWLPDSRAYVKSLEDRIQVWEDMVLSANVAKADIGVVTLGPSGRPKK